MFVYQDSQFQESAVAFCKHCSLLLIVCLFFFCFNILNIERWPYKISLGREHGQWVCHAIKQFILHWRLTIWTSISRNCVSKTRQCVGVCLRKPHYKARVLALILNKHRCTHLSALKDKLRKGSQSSGRRAFENLPFACAHLFVFDESKRWTFEKLNSDFWCWRGDMFFVSLSLSFDFGFCVLLL